MLAWTGVMFLQETVTVEVPLLLAQARLLACLREDGAAAAAGSAIAAGQELIHGGPDGLVQPVSVETLPQYLRGETTVIPMRWIDTGPGGGFGPHLDANLELDGTTSGGSRLTLLGSYRPSGRAAANLDSFRLGSVARVTVRAFLEWVGQALLGPAVNS